jgi:putative Holliday junction resolvase
MAKAESVLGIDYVESNIGLAFGRADSVTPLRVISGKNVDTAITEIARVIEDYDVDKLVIGLPLNIQGKETPESIKVRQFAKRLRIKIKKPLKFVDEHSSTKKAGKVMLNLGVSQKRRRTKDHFSAAIILRKYFREV